MKHWSSIQLYLIFLLLVVSSSSAFVNAQQLGQQSLQGNEDELANKMVELIKEFSLQRYPQGNVKRLNQIKSQGCFNGRFRVLENIPSQFKHGVFASPGKYPMYARFANASTEDDTEKDLRGLSIRVSGLTGTPIWGESGSQDFLMNSYPVLFADSPEMFYDFIKAQKNDAILGFFLNPFDSHLGALAILLQARDRPNSLFDIRYWSTTAFRLGSQDQAVKYSVKPCSKYVSDEPVEYTQNYLQQAMVDHLDNDTMCMEFMLQIQTNPQDMPIENPTVEWSEGVSPFVTVAQIQIEKQQFLSEQAMQQCEAFSFNPWQSLAEHKPLGRINYVRRLVYEKMAAFRAQQRRD